MNLRWLRFAIYPASLAIALGLGWLFDHFLQAETLKKLQEWQEETLVYVSSLTPEALIQQYLEPGRPTLLETKFMSQMMSDYCDGKKLEWVFRLRRQDYDASEAKIDEEINTGRKRVPGPGFSEIFVASIESKEELLQNKETLELRKEELEREYRELVHQSADFQKKELERLWHVYGWSLTREYERCLHAPPAWLSWISLFLGNVPKATDVMWDKFLLPTTVAERIGLAVELISGFLIATWIITELEGGFWGMVILAPPATFFIGSLFAFAVQVVMLGGLKLFGGITSLAGYCCALPSFGYFIYHCSMKAVELSGHDGLVHLVRHGIDAVARRWSRL